MNGKILIQQIRIISCYSSNMENVIKNKTGWQMVGKQLAMIIHKKIALVNLL